MRSPALSLTPWEGGRMVHMGWLYLPGSGIAGLGVGRGAGRLFPRGPDGLEMPGVHPLLPQPGPRMAPEWGWGQWQPEQPSS